MSRRRRYAPLSVYLNSRLVGRLNKATSGAIDFQYDQSWLDWQPTFAVSLSLPLREDRYIGASVTAVFENLLPDEPEVRRQIAARQHADGTDAFSLLSAIGRDCIGALQFLPEGTEPGTAGQIDARAVCDADIEGILAGLAHNPLGLEADAEFRISLAGAQEKTALLWWQEGWHIPHGPPILAPTIVYTPVSQISASTPALAVDWGEMVRVSMSFTEVQLPLPLTVMVNTTEPPPTSPAPGL